MSSNVVEMDLDRDRKAELILVRKCNDLPDENSRKEFCAMLGVPWGEYLHLRQKYSRVLNVYNAGKEPIK